ncbi:porphobilinogen deaminase, dipyromethane cofactor binding domain-containing protein [Limtongia smithiae]|uniref:porphobilinogen deaminase, dipyromethane cofactor binding domain-containing protein n=1 Tax=Limtongia smithiae TaxID=1125753 RepID=UPI0034CFA81A
MSKTTIRLGSRSSSLAVAQTEIVVERLKAAHPDYEFEIVTKNTLGDQVQSKALYAFGGKSVWTTELEELLTGENGGIHMIVHSLKDVPTSLPEQFELAAILDRADPRDVLCVRSDFPYKTLAELPAGSVVGTSSIRRSAQLRRHYPGLEFKIVRGNINTRLAKLEDKTLGYTCIILAAAGLLRLNLDAHITQYLDAPESLYAVGQGALGVEVRRGDVLVQSLLAGIKDMRTTFACTAERSLLRRLEGGCSVPLGVETTETELGELKMHSLVTSVDGVDAIESTLVEKVSTEAEAEAFGEKLAEQLLALGAGKILEKINFDKLQQS